MQLTTEPLAIAGYAVYQKNAREGGGDMTRADGSPVEYVEVADPLSIAVDGGLRRFTLDRAINGSRPEVGTVCSIVLRDWMEPDAKVGASGRPYVTRKRKNVAIGFTIAKT